MPAIYTSIPIVCYDAFLVVLAAATLMRHLKERREYKMKPNTYMVMIVRYHIMYFVLNLTNQILMVILWAHIPAPAMSLSELFSDTMPFILAPRLIISIWDTHAQDDCLYVSAAFADCVCLTSPPKFEQHEMIPDIRLTWPTGVSFESVHREQNWKVREWIQKFTLALWETPRRNATGATSFTAAGVPATEVRA